MNKTQLALSAFLAMALLLTACSRTQKKENLAFEPETISAKGLLIIIGGGERTDEIMKTIVDYGGGEDARVLVVPFASDEPEDIGSYQTSQFLTFGCKSADYLFCERSEIDNPEHLQKLDSTTVVFFSGGDQMRLADFLHGTRFLARIREIYDKGGVVSGTSAGAAIMSKIMITGKQRSDSLENSVFDKIEKGDVITSQGLGFLKNIIIDQHFVIRKRHNRLFAVLKDYPTLRGIGIDEATAIVVKPDNTMQVIGNNQVLVFEPVYREPDELNEYIVKILENGDSYQL